MNKLIVCVFLLSLVAFPRVVVGAPENDPRISDHLTEKKDKKEKKEKKPKGVPEPATILLVGAGAVAFGVVRRLRTRARRQASLDRQRHG